MNADKPRVGRPRASRQRQDGPVREEIMAAARALFRTKGFAATSTREIAAAVGLRQPSLFHYFKGKEAILEAVALATVEPVLDFISAETIRDQPPEVALFRLVYFDTLHLCTNENVLGPLSQFPEITRARQPGFWNMRDTIIDAYRQCLATGAKRGSLSVDDLETVTQFIFSLCESTLLWFPRESSPKQARQVAVTAAKLALKGVLNEKQSLTEVMQLAELDERPRV